MFDKLRVKRVFILIAMVLAGLLLQGCVPGERREQGQGERKQKKGKSRITTDVIAENLEIPWSIVFLPDNTALFTERPGRVRMLDKEGKLVSKPIAEINVNHESEGGLLGITKHPDFQQNKQVYLYYTYRQGGEILNKVERYDFNKKDRSLGNRVVIIDGIPGDFNHNGGRIKFGPDNKLYITTGDAQQQESAQDRESLTGKILRLNDDGSIPEHNPNGASPVFSYGHRNPQGLAWHPETKQLYETEHGPGANDELNKIEVNKNYGWPVIIGETNNRKYTNPILWSGGDTWAPSGMDFYQGPAESFSNNLFYGALRGVHLHRVILDKNGDAESDEKLFENRFGRIRDVVYGPDDALYILTNNRDGRGDPVASDDRIIKVRFSN